MPKKNITFFQAIREVIAYSKEYKKLYIFSLVLMVSFIFSEIISETAFAQALSNIITLDFEKAIMYAIIFLLVYLIGLNLLHFFHHKISKKVSLEFSRKIRYQLFKKILYMPYKEFEQTNVGQLFVTVENANEQLISTLTNLLWSFTKVVYLIVLLLGF